MRGANCISRCSALTALLACRESIEKRQILGTALDWRHRSYEGLETAVAVSPRSSFTRVPEGARRKRKCSGLADMSSMICPSLAACVMEYRTSDIEKSRRLEIAQPALWGIYCNRWPGLQKHLTDICPTNDIYSSLQNPSRLVRRKDSSSFRDTIYLHSPT